MLDFTELPGPDSLTIGERVVVSLLLRGCRAFEIADRLSVSHASVREQLQTILGKLGLADLLELAFYASHWQTELDSREPAAFVTERDPQMIDGLRSDAPVGNGTS